MIMLVFTAILIVKDYTEGAITTIWKHETWEILGEKTPLGNGFVFPGFDFSSYNSADVAVLS